MDHLEFEQPIVELQAKIAELQKLSDSDLIDEKEKVDISEELGRLTKKSEKLEENIFKSLDTWQISQLSRHPQRPYTLDYIGLIFDDFQELHGDRMYSDDRALICGTARLLGQPVMVIGHEKGRKTNDKIIHNFGMARPEGYRKALRLMKLAERFNMPIVTFIDTPGAYPGVGAEERGQSEAIARNLFEMSKMTVPIVSLVIGEGGSGGALAIGVGDRLLMLQYSTYSVISPEGCASILWKSADKAKEAAEALKLTADNLFELGLVDEVLTEPRGGAHRDIEQTASTIQEANQRHISEVKRGILSPDELLEKRYERIRAYGRFEE
jgi:acetyl-CoA carboxylase carboxyl transferase subunit alpha